MIIEKKALSIAEAREFIDDENADMKGFIKKFVEIKSETAETIKEKLIALDLLKIKEEHIIKLVDFLPADEEEVSKICSGLNEDEIKKILEIIKEY